MTKKEAKPKSTSRSEVESAPLTQAEFEQFLRIVTRPIEKLQAEKEKPQT